MKKLLSMLLAGTFAAASFAQSTATDKPAAPAADAAPAAAATSGTSTAPTTAPAMGAGSMTPAADPAKAVDDEKDAKKKKAEGAMSGDTKK